MHSTCKGGSDGGAGRARAPPLFAEFYIKVVIVGFYYLFTTIVTKTHDGLLPTREEFPSQIEAIASVKTLNEETAEDRDTLIE